MINNMKTQKRREGDAVIQKSRPQENFTPISNDVFRDARLNLTDRGLLTTLMSLKTDWNFTVEGMASILPDGKGRIKSSLKRLESLGYITVSHERDRDGRFAKNRLILNNTVRSPQISNPLAENRPTDNRLAENNEQYKNTNNSKLNNTRTINEKPKNLFHNFDQREYPPDFYEDLENILAELNN